MTILADAPLLTPAQIGELASSLDGLHGRVLKVIDRLQKDVEARKKDIASRWKSAPGVSAGDLARFAQNETVAAVRQIKDNSKAELDKMLKEAGPAHARLIAQRPFYDSPVKLLSRAALGDTRRTEYLNQLAYAGPAELGHMAQVAVATQNVPLAAAVLSLLDRMPSKDQPEPPLVEMDTATALRLVNTPPYVRALNVSRQAVSPVKSTRGDTSELVPSAIK